ncbi:uncharacterized protein AB675_5786 [Cyphellophora attinorum]|uniref:NIMA-interacting protein TinC n=1 Tax=Cyphellophora attinorum TaxID=1664694 RepID=A0A0N0NL40_9EURO|nr:uncharacterized protein AB675_5786 [Phialophora attinorum]KPI38738.1 hypothetical protein AB675_5786 [Phialophora attinorum]
MAFSHGEIFLLLAIGLTFLARPAAAFGAGNIASLSKVEGVNWRHGDIEDIILTLAAAKSMSGKKFSKLDIKRIYFGNWLRDYSQAVDVGTVKYVSAEAIRILLWVLGFMSFGYGTGEFEVTTERLGCYRPEEHIDNPKDYAENQDARQYDRRLRGPVDERRELAINQDTGLKNYIASENMGIDTSAALVRNLFGRAIDLGRRYGRNKNKADLYEALRLIGTGCHCLEDYSAHSNYVELALIEMGERDVFPHTGRDTTVRLRGARNEVYPIVTGTFGGTDFLHSVCGEFGDKATQSEMQELEGALDNAENSDGSVLRDLLSKIPSSLFGGKDEANKVDELQQNAQAHQMQNTKISPHLPIIQWHDEVMQGLTETIENIPILPDLIENVQDEINKFVFSLLAPYVLPVIRQIKNELETGSSEIIQSSKQQQHIVFNDDRSSDPTHSMLSKDHFSNVLNEPAGRVASATVKWVVPQLIEAWDNERADIPRILDRIINGVLHHPALRDQGGDASEGRRIMFGVVEQWWRQKDEREKDGLRRQLSRRGVENGDNHKEGVHDHGHGSYRPQGQRFGIAGVTGGKSGGQSSYPITQAFGAVEGLVEGKPQQYGNRPGNETSDKIGKAAGEAVGGGFLGNIVGGLASAVGADMLGGGLNQKKETYKRESYGSQGQHTETFTQVGQSGDRYGQAQYSRTDEPSGGRSEQYSRYEQRPGGAEVHTEQRDQYGQYREETKTYTSQTSSYGRSEYSSGGGYGSRKDDDSDEEKRRKKEKKRQEQQSYGGRRDDSDDDKRGKYGSSGYGSHKKDDSDDEKRNKYGSSGYGSRKKDDSDDDDKRGKYGSSGYGGRRDDDSDEEQRRKKEKKKYGSGNKSDDSDDEKKRYKQQQSSGYGQQQQYGSGGASYSGGRRDDDDNRGSSYGRSEGYGSSQRQEFGASSGAYGGGRRGDDDNRGSYGRSEGYGSSGGGGYGSQQQSYGGGGGYGRDNDSSSYGGGRQEYSSGGYGQQESYGSQQQSYGSRQQIVPGGFEQEEQSYGQGGGYGRRNDDDDNNRQYGSGNQGYGGGGYGGSSGGYGDDSSGYGGRRYE